MRRVLLCAGVLALCAVTASGACPNITVADSSNVTLTCNINAEGKADIDIVGHFTNAPGFIVVEVLNGQPIGIVTVDNGENAGQALSVEIHGDTLANDPVSIDNVLSLGACCVELRNTRVAGDVGAIGGFGFTTVQDTFIAGNITGQGIFARATPQWAAEGRIVRLTILGDVLIRSRIQVTSTGLPALGSAQGLVDDLVIGGTLAGNMDVWGTIQSASIGTLTGEIRNVVGAPRPTIGNLTVTGDLSGTVRATAGPDIFVVGGAFTGTLVTRSGLPDSDPGTEWQFQPGGIAGNILLGASMTFASTWDGQVALGVSPLNGPAYPETSAAIGGGAIGLIPIDIHDEDSVPAGGSNMVVDPMSSPSNILMRHYGPVTWDSGTPVIWERRPRCSTSEADWVSIPATCFGASMALGQVRELTIAPSFTLPNGFEYRLQPVMSGLSQLKTGIELVVTGIFQHAPVTDYDYTFTTGADCPENIDGVGNVDLADLQLLLFHFGTTSPDCPLIADVTGDNRVDLADLQAILFAFGTDCSCSASAMAGGGGGGATALIAEACGFNHSEAYLAWRASLSPAELANHLKDIPAILAGR